MCTSSTWDIDGSLWIIVANYFPNFADVENRSIGRLASANIFPIAILGRSYGDDYKEANSKYRPHVSIRPACLGFVALN